MEEPDTSFDVFMVVKDKATELLSSDITKFIDACKQAGVTLNYVRHPESISDALTRSNMLHRSDQAEETISHCRVGSSKGRPEYVPFAEVGGPGRDQELPRDNEDK